MSEILVQTKSLLGSKSAWLAAITVVVMVLQDPTVTNFYPQYRALEAVILAVVLILQTYLTRPEVVSVFPHSDPVE
jgi:hypothetical protein